VTVLHKVCVNGWLRRLSLVIALKKKSALVDEGSRFDHLDSVQGKMDFTHQGFRVT